MDFPNPRSQMEFPISYQSTFSDTYERVMDMGSGISNQEVGAISAIVDGTGTLITPAGTYTDVLRIKLEISGDLNTIVNGQVVSAIPFSEVTYTFMKAGYKAPLLSLVNSDFSGQNTLIATYLLGGTVGLDEISPVSDLLLFPVPSNGEITMRFDLHESSEVEFNLFAIDGRLIDQLSKQILPKGENSIDLELPTTLSPGAYMVELKTNLGAEIKKIIVQ